MATNYLILLGMSRENHQKSEIAHDLQETLLAGGGFGGGRGQQAGNLLPLSALACLRCKCFRTSDLRSLLPYFTFGNTKRIVHYTFGTPASGK
jgi:hypothetical protein